MRAMGPPKFNTPTVIAYRLYRSTLLQMMLSQQSLMQCRRIISSKGVSVLPSSATIQPLFLLRGNHHYRRNWCKDQSFNVHRHGAGRSNHHHLPTTIRVTTTTNGAAVATLLHQSNSLFSHNAPPCTRQLCRSTLRSVVR